MKKSIAIIFLMMFTLFSNQYVYGQSSKLAEEKQKQSPITVETKTMNKQNKFIKIDIKIPVVNGLSDQEFQEELNKTIKEDALKARHMILLTLQEELKLAKEQKRPFIPLELNISYEVTNTQDILSFYVTTYEFTGGAHGITGTNYFNIDIAKNQRLSLEDLFKEGSNYKDVINKEIKKQIKEQEATGQGSYFHENDPFMNDSGFQTITEDQTFYIEKGNLVIAFSQYEIAPGYMGQPTFKIPLKSFKGMLKEAYHSMVTGTSNGQMSF